MAGGQVLRLPTAQTPALSVDDWGRDAQLVRWLRPLAGARWNVSVGGAHHLPVRDGALLVTNARRFALTAVYAAFALGDATGRPVRFAGRPDIAPIGPLMRRIGGLLAAPEEITSALRNHELVLVATEPTTHPRHAGSIDPSLLAPAVATGTPVFPVASISSPFGRNARVEVAPALRSRHQRRGPLAEVELADHVQAHLQKVLDALGGVQTGVSPIDWLGEG